MDAGQTFGSEIKAPGGSGLHIAEFPTREVYVIQELAKGYRRCTRGRLNSASYRACGIVTHSKEHHADDGLGVKVVGRAAALVQTGLNITKTLTAAQWRHEQCRQLIPRLALRNAWLVDHAVN